MTECAGRYIVRIGNVIHGVFPGREDAIPGVGPDPVRYRAALPERPVQLELHLAMPDPDPNASSRPLHGKR